MPTNLLPLDVQLKTKVLLTARFWSRVPPVTLQISINKEKKKKTSRQRKLSQHELRKERHIGSKSRESPSPEDERGVNVDQMGFWQHVASGHQCYDEWFYFEWHVWYSISGMLTQIWLILGHQPGS
eukprot:1145827-Pelagomonas_calceolata.AAC.2